MLLLSPAGSPESLRAALQNGADGVYFGGAAFNARRKTLRKALGSMVTVEQLQSLGINDGLRPENLSLADYVQIADLLVDTGAAPAGSREVSND